MTELLCTGDWQLGKGDRLDDQDAVAERIAELAVARQVAGVLHAGDVFDGPVVQPEHLAVFRRFAARLREAGIPLLVARGNGSHDQARRPVDALQIFSDIPGVQVAVGPDIHTVAGVNVGCLPWVHPGRLIANDNGNTSRDEINAQAARMLARICEGLAEDCERLGGSSVLLAHWHVDAALSANGQLASDLFHEPLLQVHELEAFGFDAVVLGHNHRPQLLTSAPDDPVIPIFHVGSPMPLDFGEVGFDHGVWLLNPGGPHVAEFVPIESRPLRHIIIEEIDDLFIEEGLRGLDGIDEAIVKVSIRCTQAQQRRLDLPRLRAAVLEAGAHTVKIDVDTVREQRARVDGVTGDLNPIDAFDLWTVDHAPDHDLAARAREQMQHDLEAVVS